MVGRRLAELQVALGMGGQDDLARGLGGAGDAAQAIVETGWTADIVAAHDHRPDDEVMGGQTEILDALASMPRTLHRQPPLRESEIAVTPHLLGRSASHGPPSAENTGAMIQDRRCLSRIAARVSRPGEPLPGR